MNLDDVVKLFDAYGRKARLYPAILATAPVIWTCAAVFPALFADGPMHLAITTVMGIGGLYWMSAIARSCGKTLEPRLIAAWGGLPTTILMRHRDQTIDPYTKSRYRQHLAVLSRMPLPTADEEAANFVDADHRYQSAVRKLLEERRGPEHELVHKENASYGFWRNLQGLKPIAIPVLTVCLLVAAVAAAMPYVVAGAAPEQPALIEDFSARWALWFAIVADVVLLTFWIFAVDRGRVWQAGHLYAIALLRTLDKD